MNSKSAIKHGQKYLVFYITFFEMVAVNSPYYYENTRRL